MNLTVLQTFLAILEAGSLVRASERLNVTQSTVTARLKALEDALGQPMINRHKSGVTPTAAGLRLKRHAETITDLWRQARHETALPTAFRTVCNIGCEIDLWPGLGRRLFERVRRGEPEVALSVWQGAPGDLRAWLDSGLIDLALTHDPATRARQSLRALPADRLVLVSTRPDAPARFDPGYVYVEGGEAFGRWHAETYADADTARLAFGQATLGLDHILAEGGSAHLPLRLAGRSSRRGRSTASRGRPSSPGRSMHSQTRPQRRAGRGSILSSRGSRRTPRRAERRAPHGAGPRNARCWRTQPRPGEETARA